MPSRHSRAYPLPSPSEITPRAIYEQRREFLKRMALGVAGASLAGCIESSAQAEAVAQPKGKILLPGTPSREPGAIATDTLTPYKDVTTYNNFYEFGTDKASQAKKAGTLKTRPWTVSVEGAVAKPRAFGIEELLKLAPMEERVYRLRCVEGWSMVIPWVGFSFRELAKLVEPTGNAKFVEFVTLADDRQMPGVRSGVLAWPYAEGLRIDEAMHPLTLLAFGLYGEVLPNQNGAPVRLVVPWKYGFKSAKSLVKIRFVEAKPATAWETVAPQEYGFYSNVNPAVDHPRWSQATERRIGADGLLQAKRPTLLFNGYEAQVGNLYAGMDLRKHY
ncbi:MAG: protein-methionine-sulfoxide reductase catalytic subunit MsrP [Betaproteobacteria bacterium]|nr:protein-methionine-sulfoxide reductase catalytic subunit MsrP [Betaproteobacteria bacterium]